HRRVLPQYLDNLLVFATQPSDGFENRQIGFAGAVLFQTLSSANPDAAIRTDRPSEGVDQCSLSNPCFAGAKDYLSFAGQHLVAPATHERQRFVTTDNIKWLMTIRRLSGGHSLTIRWLIFSKHLPAFANLTDEAITTTV